MPEQRLAAYHRQQIALAKFGELAIRNDSLDLLLAEACRLVSAGLEIPLTQILQLQGDGRTLTVRAAVGWPASVVGTVLSRAAPASYTRSALPSDQPLVSADVSFETGLDHPDYVVAAGVASIVEVVIIGRTDAKPYGVLQVGSRIKRAFSEQDTDFAVGCAQLIAAAVDRIEALLETKQDAQRLRLSLEGIPQLVWRAVGRGDYIWTGPQWAAHTGLHNDESSGKGWLTALHPEDRAGAVRAWNEAAADGAFKHECRILHDRSGRYVWFRNTAVPLRDEHGAVVEWIGTATDIDGEVSTRELEARNRRDLEVQVAMRSAQLELAAADLRHEVVERRRTEDQLRQSEKLKAVGQLTGGIAHDFNNMLQAITINIDKVRASFDAGSTSDIVGHLNRADRAAGRAATLTHRLLSFASAQTLNPKRVHLDDIALSMEEMIRAMLGPAIKTEFKLFAGKLLVICDVNQMESAILNLCVNSRDAMPDGGWLTVSTEAVTLTADELAHQGEAKPGRYVAISIIDTGVGIAPEIINHIFEPFFTTKPFGQGTGLGLSQIHGFIQQSGGIIQIESTVDVGTTIRLILPLADAEGPSSDLRLHSPNKTILLVEDEDEIRLIMAEQLRRDGYRVLEAENGVSAVQLVKTGAHIDLLISDVGLPGGVDGRQVAAFARQLSPAISVIFTTGHNYRASLADTDVLRKPFTMTALTEIVRAKLHVIN